jgi:hypothetical protein
METLAIMASEWILLSSSPVLIAISDFRTAIDQSTVASLNRLI